MALSKIKAPSIADDSITVDQIADNAVHGRRNLIINGAMQVAQRGTSFSSISSSTYTLDRFAIRNATSVSQSTDIPSNEGFKNSLFYDNDGTRTSINIRQPIEDVVRLAEGKSLTLSFWMKASAATTISVDFTDKANTNVSVTTSWARYEVTLSPLTNLNPSDFYEAGAGWLDFNLGSDYPDVYLTGVQLEVGDKSTPFEHRSYQDELLACMRFYEGHPYSQGSANGYTGQIWTMKHDSTTRAFPTMNGEYRVPKRAVPTVTIASSQDGTANELSGYSSGTNYTVSAISNPSKSYVCMYFQMTDSLPTQLVVGMYEADAEL